MNGHDALSNPQHIWAANFFTATVLADHQTWAVPYVLQAQWSNEPGTWRFNPADEAKMWIDGSTGRLVTVPAPVSPFTSDTRIQILLDAQRANIYARDDRPRPRSYRGQLCATSSLIESAEGLAVHLLDIDQKPLPTLR